MSDPKQTNFNARPLPDYLYVDVPTATKKISLSILVFCIFSLLLEWTTGFMVLHPFAAIIISIAAFFFYLIGIVRYRSYGHDKRNVA